MDAGCGVARDEGEAPTRRGLLGWVTGASALGFLAMPDLVGARKRHKKKQKHKDKKTPPAYATCEERCHPSCTRCFLRPEGTPLCASQGAAYCAFHCTSDSHCVGTGHPYCTTGSYHFASGTLNLYDDCLNGNTSICTDVEPCG